MINPLEALLPRRCIFCRAVCPDGLCRACQETLPWAEASCGTAAPLLYRGTVRKAMHRFKFQGYAGYAAVFGLLMAQAVQAVRAKPDVITWVPCSRLRRWRRGYDQSELLARAVGKELGLPVERLIKKTKHTRPQTRMRDDAARRKNVQNAFCTAGDASGRHVLLIDDIYTTGATMAACRELLLSAGASEISCCTAARK